MTQEEKELLLRDLCTRLPYGVIIEHEGNLSRLDTIFMCDSISISSTSIDKESFYNLDLDEVKPYLFPLSSMTEEQSVELFKLFGISLVDSNYIKINECTGITFFLNKGFDVETHLDKLIDWLIKNHFDYRGLIPMGLAIDATNLNIY